MGVLRISDKLPVKTMLFDIARILSESPALKPLYREHKRLFTDNLAITVLYQEQPNSSSYLFLILKLFFCYMSKWKPTFALYPCEFFFCFIFATFPYNLLNKVLDICKQRIMTVSAICFSILEKR